MKIAICTAVWQRPEIFELFAKGIHHLNDNTPHELLVIVAGSEKERSKNMVEAHGFTYIEYPNQPLALKMNATTQYAGQSGCDYVLCLGSDDIIHPTLMAAYEPYMQKGIDYIGVLDWYFYDTRTGKASYWGGYREPRRKGHTCGAGRLISNRLMRQWNWAPWKREHSHMLDNSMQDNLAKTKHTDATFKLTDVKAYGLDIKSSVNMTPFAMWDNTTLINAELIKQQFSYLFTEKTAG